MTDTQLPARQPGRAASIAAIHSYADFLTEHPAIPLPTRLEGMIYLQDDQGTAEQRVGIVQEFAREQGVEPMRDPTGRSIWADLLVADRKVHGMQITHTVATHTVDVPWESAL